MSLDGLACAALANYCPSCATCVNVCLAVLGERRRIDFTPFLTTWLRECRRHLRVCFSVAENILEI